VSGLDCARDSIVLVAALVDAPLGIVERAIFGEDFVNRRRRLKLLRTVKPFGTRISIRPRDIFAQPQVLSRKPGSTLSKR